MRYTPENITTIKPNEVFVFGSNLSGIHGASVALMAKQRFGAINGQGIGLQGRSYAIPTKDVNIKTLSLKHIAEYVKQFMSFSIRNPELTFFVTKIGCGLAGYNEIDIAKLFMIYSIPDNVILPKEFWIEQK